MTEPKENTMPTKAEPDDEAVIQNPGDTEPTDPGVPPHDPWDDDDEDED